jgi:2-amino-4-hydroxy-6-hydroxymethyldihydropteridine diphosphokinase
MSDVLLSLGSNMGDSRANINEAVQRLGDEGGISVKALSPLYRTAPVGPVAQADFVNAAVRLETILEPEALMLRCLAIEAAMGRDRKNALRWGPRLIDIDMILYENRKLSTEKLILPHPRFRERAFVLVPMADIAPEWIVEGRTIKDWTSGIDKTSIRLLE